MRWVAVLVLVLVAVFAVGRMNAGSSPETSARQAEETFRDVAAVLEAAAAQADDAAAVRARLQPTEAEARWADARNVACAARADAAARLPRPYSLPEIAEFARRWLALDRAHDRRVAGLPPPPTFRAAARRLARFDARQEQGLARVVVAAERGDGSAVIGEITTLRTLAVRASATVAELGLTACFFPTAGLPY